ncbi:hypothetical protein QAD02_012608 [Eretmocerus hayati]|uniref:Uncharacterized protein n=1 Tax=Eretmocerus hayati TaxID=131215 RepID=A0ACC2P068_9HYME|nr:hypothetical protein QAD02_012608 [Eretmocerus hayati]
MAIENCSRKKLMLRIITELYEKFKEEHPEDKVSISKFFTLRPKQCEVAGSSGIHEVCVGTTHENVKLMLEGCKFKNLFRDSEFIDNGKHSFKDLLRKMICGNPTENCYER